MLAVAAGPVLRMSGIGLLGGGGIGFGERGLKRELVAGGFTADLGHGLFRAVCNRFCGSVSVWVAAFPSSFFGGPLAAALMVDLAPLPLAGLFRWLGAAQPTVVLYRRVCRSSRQSLWVST